ncbi:MAG: type III pantothenate kinase, partial [Candidatus Omnitrophica bacterium]|nr:type III pantothenate kinase [Candidatus Omnitrophota bacterium]
MHNLLAIDIGNTNITVGLFKGKKLTKKVNIPTKAYSSYSRKIIKVIHSRRGRLNVPYGNRYSLPVAISSVVPHALTRFIAELHRMGLRNITILGRDKKVPINNRYKIKSEVGQDRLV